MDIAVVSHDVLANDAHTSLLHFMVRTHRTHFVREGVERAITVDVEALARLRLPNLQQRVRQHRFVVVVRFTTIHVVPLRNGCANTRWVFEYQLVLCHGSIEDVVCHEHVQGIEAVGVVVACAHSQSLFVHVVVP